MTTVPTPPETEETDEAEAKRYLAESIAEAQSLGLPLDLATKARDVVALAVKIEIEARGLREQVRYLRPAVEAAGITAARAHGGDAIEREQVEMDWLWHLGLVAYAETLWIAAAHLEDAANMPDRQRTPATHTAEYLDTATVILAGLDAVVRRGTEAGIPAGQRAPRAGEVCECGRAATVVYETAKFGDVAHCGIDHGGVA